MPTINLNNNRTLSGLTTTSVPISLDDIQSGNSNSLLSGVTPRIAATTLNTSNFSTLASRNTLSTAQQINDLALQIANNQIRQQNKSNNSNNTNGNTFTMFVASDDIVENQKANVTSNIPEIKSGTTDVVTSSINFVSSSYIWDIKSGGNVIATCVYAAKTISSSYTSTETASTSSCALYESMTSASVKNDIGSIEVYSHYMQYASLLLGSGDDTFKISDASGSATDMLSFVAISYNRSLYKDKLDPGNVTITIGSDSYTDNSGGQNEDPTANQSYFSYDIISGSNNTQTFGIIYPSYGLILLDTSIFKGFDPKTASTSLISADDVKQKCVDKISISARAVEAVTSTYYFIRLKNGMYNYSNNPTFVTGSLGDIKIPLFKESPTTYITTVGLYNNRQELLAVARLSKPIAKSFNSEVLLQIKLDF